MTRPLVSVALAYVGGLLLGDWLQPPWWSLCVISLGIAGTASVWRTGRRRLIWPLVILAGWTNLVCRTAILSPYDLRASQRDSFEIVTVRGVLAETPSERIYLHGEFEVYRSLAQVQVHEILRAHADWQPAYGRILVMTPGSPPTECFEGDPAEITGVLAPPPGPLAEGLFDYQTYLRRQGVYYQLKCESTNDWLLLSPGRQPPLSDRFLRWAQKTLERGLPAPDESLRLLWAMTLGWKTGLTSEVSEPFMRSGTMHIFAISGLHIALIAGILVSVLRVLRVSRSWCGGLVVPAIWFYTAVTGWQPSAIRSAIMMTVIIVGWALKRPSDLLNSLAGAAFIILLWDPQQIFGASFQLSFFCVLSIGLLLPPIQKLCDRWLSTDPLLPAELVPRWRQRLTTVLRYFATALATSLASWLGSLPLTAFYFHLISPVTLLANLVIVPLSSLALACNVGSLICGAWFSPASELFNHSAWLWMELMIRSSESSTLIPGAYRYVQGPNLFDMSLYYLLLTAVLSGWFFVPKKRAWAVAGIGCLAAFYFCRWQIDRHSATLTVLPSNGGLTIFVKAPSQAADLLIDPGSTNCVQLTTKPYLRAQGVNTLAGMLLTHGDVRHTGGAALAADLFRVKQVCASAIRFRSPAYRHAMTRFGGQRELVRTIERSSQVDSWVVLHPEQGDHFPQADDNAIVLKGNLQGTRVLLLSDLGARGQQALLEREKDLAADIIITGLPSSGEPLCDALLDAAKPRVIIVADSDYPSWERARSVLRERLAEKKIPVIYTRQTGATTIDSRRGQWRIRTMSGTRLCGVGETAVGK
jgi:ComEC/Rec2-related protein